MKTKLALIQFSLLCVVLFSSLSIKAQTTVTKIATGGQQSLFVKSDGSLWVMGVNNLGELGLGPSIFYTNKPVMLVSNGVASVMARAAHSFFITTNNTVWAMGENLYGEFGDGTTNTAYVPEQVNITPTLSVGDYHTMFIRSQAIFRNLDVMGYNGFGTLGDGTFNDQHSPEQILHESTIVIGAVYVTAVAAGGLQSVFLKSDGSLWSMGYGGAGGLGDGTGNLTNRPEKIVTSGVTAIAAGDENTLFIKSDGSLWGMGDNQDGQLGNPAIPTGDVNSSTNRPTMIVSSGVMTAVGGSSHNMFIETNGSLWSMGYNNAGQLGDGTFNNTNKPQLIVTAGVTAAAAGQSHSLFLLSDGSLWGMGGSEFGELGPWFTTNQPLPVQIVGPMVANGGFESGDFLGWKISGPTTNVAVVLDTTLSHSGAGSARMGTVGTRTYISQTLNTVPGTQYLVSFSLKCDGKTPSEFVANFGSTPLIDELNFTAGPYFRLQYPVTATDTNTLLQFGFRDDPGFFEFDDVSVIPVIKPVITGTTLAGTNLVLTAANGQWNGVYGTLTSTNLLLPLISWATIATNTLDGDGNFTITATNAVNPHDSKRFFTLRLQ